jgi:tetratricopeptide (TPR) repeat protein
MMIERRRTSLLIAVLLAAAGCASSGRRAVAPAPPAVDWNARIAAADSLYAAGHYLALTGALRIYEEALAVPGHDPAVAEKFIRTAIALELRSKDLGFLTAGLPPEASSLIPADRSLERYGDWIELVAGLASKIKGHAGLDLAGGRPFEAQLDWVNARVPAIDRELEAAAGTDDLAAALRLALRADFGFKFTDKLESKTYLELHPDSPFVSFEAAMSPAFDFDRLEALLAREPGFAEVDYFLGEAALLAGKLLTAERHYLAVEAKIPGSLSVLISLAKVAFQMEETETCLEWNDKALAILPTYRDALLGKGLALGYLGRPEEALAVLGRLLELGTYYMGEGYFWTAWNLNELGRFEEARKAIERAKVFLVDVVDVHTLSGIIAYKQGRLDDAEKDLLQALRLHSSEADAAYYLGRLYADRKDWLNSAIYFSGAALAYEDKERGLEDKIKEIEASEMAPERKTRLVVKKRVQILSTQLTKATCQYNGAAGYHNVGSFERALELAKQAAANPAFAEKAAELIKMIRER